MNIELYDVRGLDDPELPPEVVEVFTALDDRFARSFERYSGDKVVVVGWDSIRHVDTPIAALVVTHDIVICAYVDTWFSTKDLARGKGFSHRESLLQWLEIGQQIGCLIVYDPDEIEGWADQEFNLIPPPTDVPKSEAFVVLARGIPQASLCCSQRGGCRGGTVSTIKGLWNHKDTAPECALYQQSRARSGRLERNVGPLDVELSGPEPQSKQCSPLVKHDT